MSIGDLFRGKDKENWLKSMSMELGRFVQGNKYGVKSTDTIGFFNQSEVPSIAKVTYANFVAGFWSLQNEQFRIRFIVGGDKLEFVEDTGAPSTYIVELKILADSTISDDHKGARFLSCDLKDFFLASPIDKPEYTNMKYPFIPDDIKDQYSLANKMTHDGYVYIKIKRVCTTLNRLQS